MTDECSGWTLETLKQFYDERLDENQRRSDERLEQLQETLRIERESIDRRFEAANRYKETYSSTLAQISNETLKRVEFDSRMGAVQEKIETLSRTNWPLYSSFGGIAISMVVGLWVIIGLKIDATNQPVVVALEQSKISNESRDRSIADIRADFNRANQAADADLAQKSREISNLQQATEGGRTDRIQLNDRLRVAESSISVSRQADATSQTDRSQLNERLHQIEGTMATGSADRKANEATIKASLVEIETQFCASDTVRNLMHANDLRVLSMLWDHAKLGTYPIANAYYPTICNRNISTGK